MSFESEQEDLFQWFKKEVDKVFDSREPLPGLDDRPNLKLKSVLKEFNKRTLILKKKYGHV